MTEENNKKNDLRTVVIGFSFILIVSVLFFLKFHFVDQKNKNTLIDNANEAQKKELASFSSISTTDLAKKIKAKEDIVILDSRDADSFNLEHILDSKNFSLEGLAENISNIDKAATYFFVDDFGLTPTEVQAMKIFRDNGITKISYLEGGITSWKSDFQPTINAGDPSLLSDRAKTSFIKSEDLAKELSDNKAPYIIDIRSSAKYKEGHILGAVNIYLGELESRRHEIPLGKSIVLYDDNDITAFQGGVRLFDAGILNVYILTNGLNEWKQKGFEVVSST